MTSRLYFSELSFDALENARGSLHPLRCARARDGGDLQRSVRVRRLHALLRHVLRVHRLLPGRRAHLRAVAAARAVHHDARLHWCGRGRSHAPARGAALAAAQHARRDGDPPRGRSRGGGRVPAVHEGHGSVRVRAVETERALLGGQLSRGGGEGCIRAAGLRGQARRDSGGHGLGGGAVRGGGEEDGEEGARGVDAVHGALREAVRGVQEIGAGGRRAHSGRGGGRGSW